MQFPFFTVALDVAVDLDEPRNRTRNPPNSRVWMSVTKVCLDLKDLMSISVQSSSWQRLQGLSRSCRADLSSLSDQLKRAALSVPVNIAEGVGRTSLADRRRHYAVARGSAMECAAILDTCRVLRAANPASLAEGRSLLLRVVRMLSRMCR